MKYDPLKPVPPKTWLALDESLRLDAVVQYHRRERIELPNERVHASFHVIVENQVAMGDSLPVAAVLTRLQREGLDRHDAVHAIASVVAEFFFNAAKAKGDPKTINAKYMEKVSNLTAESWLKQVE